MFDAPVGCHKLFSLLFSIWEPPNGGQILKFKAGSWIENRDGERKKDTESIDVCLCVVCDVAGIHVMS